MLSTTFAIGAIPEFCRNRNRRRLPGLSHPYSGVLGKDFIKMTVRKCAVNLRAVEGEFDVRELYSLRLVGVAVVVKLHRCPCRSEATLELFLRFAAVHRKKNIGLHLGNRIFIQLLLQRESEPVFLLYCLRRLVAFVKIIALINCFAMQIHAVIHDMEMRIVGFKVLHNYILRVPDGVLQ